MLNSFVSASSSRSTLADLLSSLPLRVVKRDQCLGSGLTANRINQFDASGLYPAFDLCSGSPRPALCIRPSHDPLCVCILRCCRV